MHFPTTPRKFQFHTFQLIGITFTEQMQRKKTLIFSKFTQNYMVQLLSQIFVLASAAHILKLERYREDYHGPYAKAGRRSSL